MGCLISFYAFVLPKEKQIQFAQDIRAVVKVKRGKMKWKQVNRKDTHTKSKEEWERPFSISEQSSVYTKEDSCIHVPPCRIHKMGVKRHAFLRNKSRQFIHYHQLSPRNDTTASCRISSQGFHSTVFEIK
jgi:hypothetical protein